MARDGNRDDTASIRILRASRSAGLWGRVRTRDLWDRTLEMPALWTGLFLLLGTWSLMPGAFLFSSAASPGTIADRDFVATRDLLVPDEEATRIREEQTAERVPPVYDLDPGVIEERDTQLAQLFARGRRLVAEPRAASEGVEAIAERLLPKDASPDDLNVDPPQLRVLVAKKFSADLEDRIRGVLAQALRRGVVANKPQLLENRMRGVTLRNLASGNEQLHLDLFDHLGYPDEAREFLESEVRDWSGFGSAERRVLVDLLFDNLPPNLLLNRSETLTRRAAAAAAVGEVMSQFRKGQMIVRKGDVIDPGHARIIAQMRGERQLRRLWAPLAGTFLLIALSAWVVWIGIGRERVADHSPGRIVAEGLVLLLLLLLGAKFCLLVAGALSGVFETAPLSSARSYAYATPFASLALLVALLLGRQTALVLSVLSSVLASRLVVDGDGLWVVFYSLAGSLAAIYALDRFQFRHRLVIARVGLVVGAINLLMVLIFNAYSGLAAERGVVQVGFDAVCALAGGLLVAAVASFAVPILEWLLGITTDIKLVELANTNLPLLRRLAFEAPGTFQHSLMVANLAKEGCEAIGADSVLAYTGGLYHDVGKVMRPDYFIENQRPGSNPHDKLLPSMSALILIAHVKDGLELAREHNLPRVVLDAIRQHHGTRLIKFFYNKAQRQREDGGEVTEEKYRYLGPSPQNKVMGVLMLADAVEAASRTLIEPTPVKIREMIRAILDDCLNDGQFDHTDLTLSDLRQISESFHRVLTNIFHQRIDYPGFDFNAVSKREKRAVRQAS